MIKIYGANWCGDTQRTLEYLDSLSVDYDYIDLDTDISASDWVKSQNQGKEMKPTLVVGASVLSVPDERQLKAALEREGIIDKP